MPTVYRGQKGWYIKSRRYGRHITHQLSDEGASYLRPAHPELHGCDISVPTLLELKRLGHATIGKKRHGREGKQSKPPADFRDPIISPPASAPPLAPPPPPTPTPVTVSINNHLADPKACVWCPRCQRTVTRAPHCSHCGGTLPTQTVSDPAHRHADMVIIVAVVALVAIFAILMGVLFMLNSRPS